MHIHNGVCSIRETNALDLCLYFGKPFACFRREAGLISGKILDITFLRNQALAVSIPKPAFFGDLPWPCIWPDLDPVVGKLPAKERFEEIQSQNSGLATPSDLEVSIE